MYVPVLRTLHTYIYTYIGEIKSRGKQGDGELSLSYLWTNGNSSLGLSLARDNYVHTIIDVGQQ